MTNRREFLSTLALTLIATPRAANGQPQGKMPRVGVLVAESAPHPFTEAFRSGMRELGYVEGRNISIEWRYADALFSRAVELATELVRLPVDVLLEGKPEGALQCGELSV
jgi:putative ABC transport system substrate-binding protein